jgi:hypothetical protein
MKSLLKFIAKLLRKLRRLFSSRPQKWQISRLPIVGVCTLAMCIFPQQLESCRSTLHPVER